MARKQVQDLRGPEALQVTSNVLNTYYQPARQGVAEPNLINTGTQLSQALDSLTPGISAGLKARQKAQQEADTKQARADRLVNQENFADLVRRNPSLTGLSPHYVKEYKRADGEIAAQSEYRSFLNGQFEESGLVNQDFTTEAEAGAAFSQFVDQSRAQFLAQTGRSDVDFIEGFEQFRPGIEGALAGHSLTERIKANEEKYRDSVGLRVNALIHPDSTPEEIGANIDALGKDAIGRLGYSGKKFNEDVGKQLVASALAAAGSGDYAEARRIIDVADSVPTGTGKLSGITAVRDNLVAASNRISTMQRSEESYEWSKTTRGWAVKDREHTLLAQQFQIENQIASREARARASADRDEETVRDLASQQAMMEAVANPLADHTDLLEELAADPATASLVPGVQSFINARLNAATRVVEDPLEIATLKSRIMDGTAGPQDILAMVADGSMDTNRAVQLISDSHSVTARRQQLGALNTDQRGAYNEGTRMIRSLILGGAEFAEKPQQQTAVVEATTLWQIEYLSFLEKNPNATPLESIRLRSDFIEALQRDQTFSALGIEDRDENAIGVTPVRSPAEIEAQRDQRAIEDAASRAPQSDIDLLIADPSPNNMRFFNDVYGPGTAAFVLNKTTER